MDFCRDAVPYDPALPSPTKDATPVSELVKAQEDAAMTMFVYHLNGMGYEAWDYRNPSQSDSDCIRSVWKMVCYTYFPRAAAGCKQGEQSLYKRPCSSSCSNYVRHCGVECCDESVKCVFAHTQTDTNGQIQLLQSGYVDQSGPSAACTGASGRSRSSPFLLLLGLFGLHWAATDLASDHNRKVDAGRKRPRIAPHGNYKLCMLFVAVSLGMLLQGCDMDIPRHSVGNWRKNVNYLQAYSYLPPGQRSTGAVLNSCSLQNVPATEQCNGRGYCRAFSQNSFAAQQATPLSFCQCERDWADPECSTKRKSQLKAFFFSLFLGPFGGDYFYLGFPLWGISKLLTLGGLGFWWLVDIVRIGSGPVYAYDFRTAADLPHWVALLVMIFVCMMLGFAVAVLSYLFYRKEKRKDVMNLQTQEESRFWKRTQEDMQQFDGPRFRPKQMPPGSQVIQGPVGFSGYGATLPLPVPNAQVPFAQYNPQSDRPPYSGPFGPSGLPGQGSPTPASIGIAPTQMPILRNGEIPRVDNELDISIPRVQ